MYVYSYVDVCTYIRACVHVIMSFGAACMRVYIHSALGALQFTVECARARAAGVSLCKAQEGKNCDWYMRKCGCKLDARHCACVRNDVRICLPGRRSSENLKAIMTVNENLRYYLI
jgi:hypothetical protein